MASLKKEMERRASGKARVLTRLQEGPATNVELSAIALRFGARLFELRVAGYVIDTKEQGEGIVRYTLVSVPEPTA